MHLKGIHIYICMHSRGARARVQRGLQNRGISQKSVLLLLLVMQVWVWFERTCEFSGIQFTKHFIESVFVETRKLVSRNSNMILKRQTCGQC